MTPAHLSIPQIPATGAIHHLSELGKLIAAVSSAQNSLPPQLSVSFLRSQLTSPAVTPYLEQSLHHLSSLCVCPFAAPCYCLVSTTQNSQLFSMSVWAQRKTDNRLRVIPWMLVLPLYPSAWEHQTPSR